MPSFDDFTECEFERIFLNILNLTSKDNTYKFALARFLLDYSREHGPRGAHVGFHTMAEYFLSYYWPQVCKLKMKHAPQSTKKPMIVSIIEKEFDRPYYPQAYPQILAEEPERINRCVESIVKRCFHNVTWRFQRIRTNGATEVTAFYSYTIKRVVNRNKKYVDLDAGITLNPEAMAFLKKYNVVLLKATILEWARFLEQMNLGLPKIITKTEGKSISRRGLSRYKRRLRPLFERCFYCNGVLEEGSKTHVEHVIPFDYIAEDNIWNLALACKPCNMRKLGALPPMKFIEKITDRNRRYREAIPGLDRSLRRLDSDFGRIIRNHYETAKSHGYMVLERFPDSGPAG